MVILLCPIVVAQSQIPLVNANSRKAITPELSNFIEGLVKDATVPGLALGVVHADGESEYGAWGIRTEEGDDMTTDVRPLNSSISYNLR